jgi:hypothetical protein
MARRQARSKGKDHGRAIAAADAAFPTARTGFDHFLVEPAKFEKVQEILGCVPEKAN